MSELPANTIDTIKRAVSNAFHQVVTSASDNGDAANALDDARKAATGQREKLLTTLAGASAQFTWDSDAIAAGIDAAVAGQNHKKNNTLTTFAAEVRKAMRPSVRGHVAAMFDLAAKAWDAEDEAIKADKKADRPLRKAFARKYHLVVGTLFDLAMAGNAPTEISELSELAVRKLRERQLDAAKVFSQFKALREQLAAFVADFPVENLDVCVEYLNDMTLDEFKACVDAKNNALAGADVPAAAPVEETESAPVEETESAPVEEYSPVQGVSDLTDDVLREMAGVQLAA